MNIRHAALLALASWAGAACNNTAGVDSASSGWLIPEKEVRDGGPGKDGIPAINAPRFVAPDRAGYLREDDLVLGAFVDGKARAYPHPILDWHEIINDDLGGRTVAVTYCPLTGTGIGIDPEAGGAFSTFGVSGLLYNSNLIAYDRRTDSYWSQMLRLCVNGDLRGATAAIVPLLETRWDTWKRMYPSTDVVSSETGYARPYGTYPYRDYRTSDVLLFPVNPEDRRLPRKERVYGVLIGDRAAVYRLGDFPDTVGTINDTVNGVPVIAVGSRLLDFAAVFERTLPDGTVQVYRPVQGELPVVMRDGEGTRWTVFGHAVSGPRAGAKLGPVRGYAAYWFAWGAFFPGSEIRSGR